jgi:type II secretory ATPase GspE/PulE/Tfp pilus assembly ATPase PilB-like protein
VAEIDFSNVQGPVDWLDRVFRAAIDAGWSDLQLRLIRGDEILALGQEGAGSTLVVRARINREMQVVADLTGRNADTVVTRIKSVAGIGSGPAIEPLDGLYSYVENDAEGNRVRSLDIRVAVFPTYVGETLALRLPSTDGIATLDELAFSPRNRELVNQILGIANGLVLLAGPMGSGKSTTLRGMLLEMGGDKQSVWTVEDPVELQIEGIEQININAEAGNGWPAVLTGLRRSDLQVLMIGEIRNYDQASAALEIGNAGAKVLSSIHANDSVGAVQQLMELADAKPRTLGNQLRAVISQRLIRTICTECGSYDPDCENCNGSGYKGLRPVHEILILNEDFITALAAGVSSGDLRAAARSAGMLTLRETAQELIDEGLTTEQEVWRVLGND